jgi:hypothetical protein
VGVMNGASLTVAAGLKNWHRVGIDRREYR